MSPAATRHGGLVAGAALVVAATWITALARAARPLAVVGATVGVVAAATGAVVVGAASLVSRRWPRRPATCGPRSPTACSSPR